MNSEIMQDFGNIGVLLQLGAMIMLLLKIVCTFNCTGISGRTQILNALVFTTRFLDLPNEFRLSLPSFIMKIVYLFIVYLTVISIYVISRKTYQREHDNFRIDLLIGTCLVMAMLSCYKMWNIITILWYFSLYLETFALFPQIQMTARMRYAGSSLVFYIGMLACYRLFYIVDWIYLLLAESRVDSYHMAINGCAQFLIYCSYFGWILPIFKAQYSHLKNVESQVNLNALSVVVVQSSPRTNDDMVKDKSLMNC